MAFNGWRSGSCWGSFLFSAERNPSVCNHSARSRSPTEAHLGSFQYPAITNEAAVSSCFSFFFLITGFYQITIQLTNDTMCAKGLSGRLYGSIKKPLNVIMSMWNSGAFFPSFGDPKLWSHLYTKPPPCNTVTYGGKTHVTEWTVLAISECTGH